MRKTELLERWRSLDVSDPSDERVARAISVVPYRAEGSRFGSGGIRIDGSPEFVDTVLARLKDLLAGEGQTTRLQVSHQKIDDNGKPAPNAVEDAESVTIRVVERGHQAKMANAFVASLTG